MNSSEQPLISTNDKGLYNQNVQALVNSLNKSDVEYVCLEALKTILMQEFTHNLLSRRKGHIGINLIAGNIVASKEMNAKLCELFESPELYELDSKPIFYVVHVPFDKLESDNIHCISDLCKLNDLELKLIPSWKGFTTQLAICIYRLESLDLFNEKLKKLGALVQ